VLLVVEGTSGHFGGTTRLPRSSSQPTATPSSWTDSACRLRSRRAVAAAAPVAGAALLLSDELADRYDLLGPVADLEEVDSPVGRLRLPRHRAVEPARRVGEPVDLAAVASNATTVSGSSRDRL